MGPCAWMERRVHAKKKRQTSDFARTGKQTVEKWKGRKTGLIYGWPYVPFMIFLDTNWVILL